MHVFEDYSQYYDLLYQDKNYGHEADYLVRLIRQHHPQAQSILELGSGTGKHAILLAEKGYTVDGIDRSPAMVEQAKARLKTLDKKTAQRLQFDHGNLCDLRRKKRYDGVISLFHVMSYQTREEELLAAFQAAANHLNPGGIFIFDCWYGPAVLANLPTMRIKRVQEGALKVIRIAEPAHFPNQNRVDVHYQVIIHQNEHAPPENIREVHSMRYLFKPEISRFLADVGLTLVADEEWVTGNSLSLDTWSACWVAQKP